MAQPQTFTVTGDDTLSLYDRIFTDFADDDVTQITFPNDLVAVKTGKNRNTIYAKNETGNNVTLTLRLTSGSSDDQFLANILQQSAADFVSTILGFGQFVKRVGDGQGGTKRVVWTLQGGVITRGVDGKDNVNGDTVQAVSIYNFTFATASRTIQ